MQENSRQQQKNKQREQILFATAHELLQGSSSGGDGQGCYSAITDNLENPVTAISAELSSSSLQNDTNNENCIRSNESPAAIISLRFPFELKPDQVKAVESWLANHNRGSIIYGSGTGKTEISFECAKRAALAAAAKHNNGDSSSNNARGSFNILMLVPRIVLVEQNYRRLVSYGILPEKIGKYFGEEKEIREITISTYHSAIGGKQKRNLDIVKRANMVIFDEVHLASGTARAFSRIFDAVAEDKEKALLGLTATIDEQDPRNSIIVAMLPPVRKYLIKDAVEDGRLARPVIFPIKVALTAKEQKAYDEHSKKIRTISARFKRYDASAMMELMKSARGGFPRWQARAWFVNVRKRKSLLASADNKLATAVGLIKEKHSRQKVMVFSETVESIRKLKQLLKAEGIESALVDSRTPSSRRHKVLSQWGRKFYPLLSVHTLEIGYDVPEAAVEIILASTSNMNQVVQRIGRVLRKVEGKSSALVYVIHVSETRDSSILAVVKKAVESSGGRGGGSKEDKEGELAAAVVASDRGGISDNDGTCNDSGSCRRSRSTTSDVASAAVAAAS